MKELKKSTLAVLLSHLLIVGLLSGCSGGASGTSSSPGQSAADPNDLKAALANFKPITLNWAISMGASHKSNEVFNYFCDRINKLTEGKITITPYPGETLVKNTDIYESLVNGIVDMGEADPFYSFSYFPLVSAYFLPGISFKNSTAATYAANEWFQSDFPELKKAKFLWADSFFSPLFSLLKGDFLKTSIPVTKNSLTNKPAPKKGRLIFVLANS